MARTFPIVDLFAGPGGLGEGFSAFRDSKGRHPFRIAVSVEKEESAFETLRLRSFLRQFKKRLPKEYYDFINAGSEEPDWAEIYPQEWDAACKEALKLELGTPGAKKILKPRLSAIRAAASGNTVLIGGPPCQAYSLVGRARNRGIDDYDAHKDHRHYLYREYIEVIRELRPAVFVMENVKGMISSSIDGTRIFESVLADLRRAGGKRDSYTLFSLTLGPGGMSLALPADIRSFVVRAEEFDVPQARHRVIIVGVRGDIAKTQTVPKSDARYSENCAEYETVRNVLEGLPRLRSGLSRSDSDQNWCDAVEKALVRIIKITGSSPKNRDISLRARQTLNKFRKNPPTQRSSSRRPGIGVGAAPKLKKWIVDPKLNVVPNNRTRKHMDTDLARYLFVSIFGQIYGRSPKAKEFPRLLSPAHDNWKSGKFADRFRVQLYDRPSTTITSHISKDGHYYIHPDPLQCRALTVREAARLQTFPDNYFFKGNRTEQYVQVGNAVPPFLALQIAGEVANLLARPRQ